ncbi:MAG: hypothetical protein LBT55_04585 [Clostridiaceae bacterium]|jgi:hypothetical protein|nr:hypothetical protein [Clostridiaceae bacterium]
MSKDKLNKNLNNGAGVDPDETEATSALEATAVEEVEESAEAATETENVTEEAATEAIAEEAGATEDQPEAAVEAEVAESQPAEADKLADAVETETVEADVADTDKVIDTDVSDTTDFTAPKVKKPSKILKFVKAHKLLTFIVAFVVLLAAGLTTGHFVATRDLIFVRSSADIVKAAEKGKGNRLVFKKDVTVDGDLSIDRVYSIDLNGYTLKVNGTLTFTSSEGGGVDIGTLKKDKYGKDGLIEATTAIWKYPNADISVHSAVKAASVVVEAKSLTVNEVKADSLEIKTGVAVSLAGEIKPVNAEFATVKIVSPEAFIRGNLGAANLFVGVDGIEDKTFISGTVNSVNGGDYIKIENGGEVGTVTGAAKTVVGVGGAAKNIYGGEVVIQEQLTAPSEITINQNGADIICTVTKTPHADKYVYEIYLGSEKMADGESILNSFFITGLEPGAYELKVRAVSDNAEAYLESAVVTKTFNFAGVLLQPAVSVVTENGRVLLRITKVPNANKYEVIINGGTPVSIAVADAEYTELDITETVVKIGTYAITVVAKSGQTYYADSPQVLVTHVTYETLSAPVFDAELSGYVKNDAEEIIGVNLVWNAVANAKYYKVTIGGAVIYTTETSLSADCTPGDVVSIQAVGHSLYYLDSEAVTLEI